MILSTVSSVTRLGTFSKPVATIIFPKSPTFQAIFVKLSKYFIFLVKPFWGNFYRQFATFYWSHCSYSEALLPKTFHPTRLGPPTFFYNSFQDFRNFLFEGVKLHFIDFGFFRSIGVSYQKKSVESLSFLSNEIRNTQFPNCLACHFYF